MTTLNGNKVRIYDLARIKTPAHLDEKIKKKIQAEITREVLRVAPEFGQSAKTASSSIDAHVVDSMMNRIKLDRIIETLSGEASNTQSSQYSSNSQSTTGITSSASDDNKPKLRIVRRIQAGPSAEEIAAAEAQAAQFAKEEEDAKQAENTNPEITEENPNPNNNLQDMMNKKPSYTRESVAFKDMSNVKSIPLKPTAPLSTPAFGQPYRVAKPTVSSHGIGRKKKRGQVDERPKVIRPRFEEKIDLGPKEITITKPMTVRELSQRIAVPETSIITYFFMKRIVKTVNDILEKDLIVEYLRSLNYIVNTEQEEEAHHELVQTLKEDKSEGNLERRPPVVTIMGHVDHGKTTLVDTIRKTKSKIVDRESGGITQHISTYRIEVEDFDGNTRKITLLDTPGHEAFAAMRKRGANVTDIVVLIVAADDGVMPQTLECINYIKENHIPFVVAVNKIDKPGANPDKVLGQLAEYDVITQNYGGTVECAYISALQNQNIDDLLMKVMLVADAELSEKIQSNPNRLAVGTVIEAELSRTKGPLATILIQNGTLKVGDSIAAGSVFGKVKSMLDETGQVVKDAVPSSAVTVLGLNGVPKAGEPCKAYSNIHEAKEQAEIKANEELETKRFRGIYSFASEIKEGQEKELRIIIRADVQGSAEAISHEINKLSTGEVLVKPISLESGSITANDVMMAERTGAVIVGFHVGTDAQTAKLAEKLNVKIKSYEIIYKLTEDLERAVLGLHEPEYHEERLGTIEIRRIFNIDKRNIAGSYVTSGKIVRNEIARVMRDGVKIYEGKVDYLKRFKDDAREVKEGFECGLSFEKYNDLQEGDIVECWTIKEVSRTRL